ncbi:MAG: DEAD/DEAH box helicase [Microthrixaceae bacterium]
MPTSELGGGRSAAEAPFSQPVRAWFEAAFPEPTPAQAQAWPPIAAGEHTLLCAPTGSGKTLAAFLWAIDRLGGDPRPPGGGTRVVYISPLRALAVDVEKNLRSPIRGIELAAQRLGGTFAAPTVGLRTGDTPPDERRKMARKPPDILVTTPESLYLLLTSAAREGLAGVETVIVDEIHALAPTKRGAHLALSLERLHAWVTRHDHPAPQRIGLSATQRPLETVAGFLGGRDIAGSASRPRAVRIVDAGITKELDLEVRVPVEDMASLGTIVEEPQAGPAAAGPQRRSIWPSMHPALLELVEQHRSTLIFVNARRLSERLASRLNELHDEAGAEADAADDPAAAAPARSEVVAAGAESIGTSNPDGIELVKAHHGSLSRERRLLIEDELKRGTLAGLVATSSLELGIDMGAVDLVIQVASPGSVAAGLQRIGRAGHQVGVPSRGRMFPRHRADLLEAAVVAERMHSGEIEHTKIVRNPLDVLAQQLVAAVALDDVTVDELFNMARASASFAELSDAQFRNTLDLVAGRYPAEEFGGLSPRVVWDRTDDVVRARRGTQRIAVTSGGTIPDRGLYAVVLPDGTRVGELDEEMVYESRVGETFLLGATTWRIEDITFQQVVVTPAPGVPGKMPFWHGDGPGRPVELGRAMGAFVRELRTATTPQARARLRAAGLDEWATDNLLGYLDDQAEATDVVPDDHTIVVERFRDEIGDWRICVLSPFGGRVHAPWAVALRQRLAERWDDELGEGAVEVMWADDGVVIRLPESVDELPLTELMIDPDEAEALVVAALPSTAAFAAAFRESAARSLLLPKRRPDRRTPLWQQRQRAADLLGVAAKYPQFPILLEATRELLEDHFDLPALRTLLGDLSQRRTRLVPVDTDTASPFAQSLVFGWVAVYLYEGDAPLAERRAAALSLDRNLLADLLGSEELRSLLDADVVASVELERQRLADGRRARDVDEVHDALRTLGPLAATDIQARCEADAGTVEAWIDELTSARRAYEVTIGGEPRHAAAEDAGRLRDALGAPVPLGLPNEFTEAGPTPVRDLVTRYARTHGPFTAAEVARWFGLPLDVVTLTLEALAHTGGVVSGEFRPGGAGTEWVDAEVLMQLRRRSLAALRREVEPVDGDALARFLPAWQHVGSRRTGADAVADALETLEGAALPVSLLDTDLLGERVRDYSPSLVDQLCTSGEVVWAGAGPLGASDGRIRLVFRDRAALLLPEPTEPPDEPHHGAIIDHLAASGASFWGDLQAAVAAAGLPYDDPTVLEALWDLVWAGVVTNDSLAPVRARVAAGPGRRGARSTGGRSRGGRSSRRGAARPRAGRVSRVGPPAAAGRWSLVAGLTRSGPDGAAAPSAASVEVRTARAMSLLDRYGVLTREMALAEGAEGGFAGVYPVLKLLEERGEVRRGYFVAGLGAAQFAHEGAAERLRTERESVAAEPQVRTLAAVDPAQPYGAALAWPDSSGNPSRTVGAHVVLVDGLPAAYLERGQRSLVSFPGGGARPELWVPALACLVADGRVAKIELATIDGEPSPNHPLADTLKAAGFQTGYRGLTLR